MSLTFSKESEVRLTEVEEQGVAAFWGTLSKYSSQGMQEVGEQDALFHVIQ